MTNALRTLSGETQRIAAAVALYPARRVIALSPAPVGPMPMESAQETIARRMAEAALAGKVTP
jgi:hypothetical protein